MSKYQNAFALLDDSDDEGPKAAPAQKKEVKAADNNKEKRRPNNDDRNTKGGRGPRKARDGKRTYDRRSGTGRGKEIKKGGGGGRNWGSDKNEARKNQGPIDENEIAEAVEQVEIAEEPVVEEEEDNTMTMEEFLASKSGKAAGDDLFGSKEEKAVEDDEFAGKTAHVAVEEDFLVMGPGKKVRQRAAKKEKQTLDLNFRVASGDSRPPRRENERRGGGRGGRGERRRNDKRGGRGGKRSGGRGAGIKVNDMNAFPSL